jgi:hypothetical protein
MARRLVLWGVVTETLCSIALFVFDEGASRAQQSIIETQQAKIILLEIRDIDFNAFKKAMADVPLGRVEVWYGPGTDSRWLALRILAAFGMQGWQLGDGDVHPVQPDDSLLCRQEPPIECMGGNMFGVTVVINSARPKEDERTQTALMNALISALKRDMWGSDNPSVPPGTMRIMVGPRS